MILTIGGAFEQFRKNLQITSLQTATVSERQNNIRGVLTDAELDVTDSFLTGSYRRDTLIAPLIDADVDVFVVLHPKHHSNDGHVAILNSVAHVLRRTYSQSGISRNGQAVTIEFSDFNVDVVPGFKLKTGAYRIPDSHSKRWIDTDPKQHVAVWTEFNQKHEGRFIPLIKMIKRWNVKQGSPLRSFHLETMVLYIFANRKFGSFPGGMEAFFEDALKIENFAVPDPAEHSSNLGGYLNIPQRLSLSSALRRSLESAQRANHCAAVGRLSDAMREWKGLFGEYFPAYE